MADTEMTETEDYDKSADPTAHASSHESGGPDEIDALGLIFPSAFRCYMSASQTVVPATTTLLNLDLLSFDKNNDYSIVNKTFTAPRDGTYFFAFTATINLLSSAKSLRTIISVNGSGISSSFNNSSGSSYISSNLFFVVSLNENDSVDFRVYHDDTANKNIMHLPENTQALGFTLY